MRAWKPALRISTAQFSPVIWISWSNRSRISRDIENVAKQCKYLTKKICVDNLTQFCYSVWYFDFNMFFLYVIWKVWTKKKIYLLINRMQNNYKQSVLEFSEGFFFFTLISLSISFFKQHYISTQGYSSFSYCDANFSVSLVTFVVLFHLHSQDGLGFCRNIKWSFRKYWH